MFHSRSNPTDGLGIIRRTAASAGVCITLIFSGFPLGWALPPGGAQPDTPGTSSSVSPSTVEQCGILNFTINGYPPGETVHIKIDNGEGFGGDASIQGQGVIHSQAIDSSGTASGSFQVPCELPAGEHFLRYLATEVLYDTSGNQQGTKGYTNVGNSVFYVTESAAGNNDAVGVDSNTAGTGTGNAAVSNNANNRNNGAGGAGGAARGGVDSGTAGGTSVAEGGQAVSNQAHGGVATAGGSGVQVQNGSSTLQSGAAKASGFGANKSAANAANGGIFDKNAQENGVNLAAASGQNSIPYIGFFVGGAILLVGMTAINAWLYVQRHNYSSPK